MEHKTLAAALVAALGEMTNPQFDAVNPAFKARYATLANILSTIRPVLAKNGLAITQTVDPYQVEGAATWKVTVTTKILHTTGETMESAITLPASKADAQGIASAITYARRYALSAICNIAGDDDDDGNTATGGKTAPATNGKAPAAPAPVEQPAHRNAPAPALKAEPEVQTITEQQRKQFMMLGTNLYGADAWVDKRPALIEWVTGGRSKHTNDMTTEEAAKLIDKVAEKVRERDAQKTVAA
jgi:hypothetical protein